jgi:hypothetical protein
MSFPARIKDISRLGLLLAAEQALEVGVAMHLTFELPGGEPIKVLAQSIRIERSGESVVIAVLFAPMARATLNWIDAFLSDPAHRTTVR